MQKTNYIFIIFFSIIFSSHAQNYWQKVDDNDVETNSIKESYTNITKHQLFSLNYSLLKNNLENSPYRHSGEISQVNVDFPVENTFKEFAIYKVKTLDDQLAQSFPNIQSYVGVSKDKKANIRITLTNQGFFGMILQGRSASYINPYTKDASVYEVFNKIDASRSENLMSCLFDSEENEISNTIESSLADVDEGILRDYRLAVATTGEYSQFHINQAGVSGGTDQEQKDAVLSAMIVTIDRVNQIYERDFSITLTLVDGVQDIIYLDGNTDPLNNNSTGQLINQSQTVIDDVIGSANYDIGHTFSTGAGGLAQLYSVCNLNQKARGVTGISAPIGDAFDIDYVSHEVGHQFGANHTFNSTEPSCAAQKNNSTAVEPGSGTTIMAYAGICPGQNVQGNSGPYFHAVSINEIYNNASSGSASNCPSETSINNNAPIIISVPDYTIPYGTAFILDCEASDLENDNLTYTWEQTDNGVASVPPASTSTNGALFRSNNPSEDSFRYFPSLSSVIAGNLYPTWEVIPDVARQMNFAVTVRDNNILGGQSSRENTTLTTSQSVSGISYDQNQEVEITWDVAGTDANGINTQFVNILLSYNAGLQFSEVIATNVPNTGSAMVNIPQGSNSPVCKIKVEAVDNVYYAINDSYFTITNEVLNVDSKNLDNLFTLYPNPTKGSFHINFSNQLSASDAMVNIYDITGRRIYSNVLTSEEIKINNPQSGIYLVEVINNSEKSVKKLIIE